MKAGTQAHYRCEICHFTYQFRRLWWAHLLGHPATSFILFLLLMVGSSWLLGYVPITEPLIGVPAGSNVWLHWLDGLLLLGLLGALMMLVAACTGLPGLTCEGCWCPGDFCPYMVVGGGEECAALLVVALAALAVAGLVFLARGLYGMLYAAVREQLKWAEHMVENIGETARRGGGGGGGGGRGSGGRGRGADDAGGVSGSRQAQKRGVRGAAGAAGGGGGAGGSGAGPSTPILTPPAASREDMV